MPKLYIRQASGPADISPPAYGAVRSPTNNCYSPPQRSGLLHAPHMPPPPQQHFFNCAAPKSVLQQNCQAMRQVQQHYPPYPHHVGVHQIHPPPGVPFMGPRGAQQQKTASSSEQQKPFTSSTLPAAGVAQTRAKRNPNGNSRRTPSILKHYKSCPVSPVHEEVEWSADNKSIIITEPKRHSVYADDARTILDMIQADTEKMIAEITRKYGDLDDIGVDIYDPVSGSRHSQIVASKSVPDNLAAHRSYFPRKETVFSPEGSMSPRVVRQPYVPLAPKHSFSEFYVYQEIYQCERKVSLSDILNDNPEQMAEARRLEEARFLETQRHSSASFFLTSNNPFAPDRSQESLLSEEFMDDGSYCNSMESILSDESDCKSAPLEQQVPKHPGLRNFIIHGPTSTIAAAQMVSKSYGSSPNAYGSFDYYMQQRHLQANVSPYESFDVSSYNLEKIQAPLQAHDRKPLPPKPMPTSKTYPKLSEPQPSAKVSDDIPTLKCKNQQYSSGVSKSISSDFAQQRWQRSSNPLQTEKAYNEKLFQKKAVKQKPPVPAKPESLKSTLTSTVEAAKLQVAKEPLKKSCSFEVDTSDVRCSSRTASVVRKFERNLQKFEREKQAELQAQKKRGSMRPSVSSGALAAQSCLKKVSKFDGPASRRATSMRQKERPKISVRFNTVSQIKYTPSCKRSNGNGISATTTTCPLNDINLNVPSSAGSSLPSDYGEKTFEMFISENGNDEHDNMNMDNLKLYTKPGLQAVVDEIKQERQHRDSKHKKNLTNTEITQQPDSGSGASSTSNQCKNIAKKIDIIQKLIEMEERKFEQIRLATESRMRPFECDTKQRGYVKSLTMNFDMLAKGIEKDIENEQRRILAGGEGTTGTDADLCAYARHIKRNVSLPDVLESTDTYALNKKLMQQQQQQKRVQLDTDGVEVELAKEVKADSDVDNEEEKEDGSEKVSEDHADREDEGNPKNLHPMPVEESSSIRRACSLSDLHMGNMGKGAKSSSSSQKPGATHRNSSATRTANKRNTLQSKGSSTNLNANASMGVLNQSDSENENNGRGRSGSNGQGRSNGPTTSNRNYNNNKSNGNNNRRKGTLQPSFNNSALPQDDSSSEETQGSSSNAKPIVPPRPRNLAFDHKNKVLNSPNVVKQRGVYEAVEFADIDSNGDPKSQVHNVINKLYTTTQTVLQLHANLRNCEDSLMLKELENAVIMTQNMLTNITQNKNEKSSQQLSHGYSMAEQTNLENGDYMMMVNNCADLLSNFRMKHKTDDCENNS